MNSENKYESLAIPMIVKRRSKWDTIVNAEHVKMPDEGRNGNPAEKKNACNERSFYFNNLIHLNER